MCGVLSVFFPALEINDNWYTECFIEKPYSKNFKIIPEFNSIHTNHDELGQFL